MTTYAFLAFKGAGMLETRALTNETLGEFYSSEISTFEIAKIKHVADENFQ